MAESRRRRSLLRWLAASLALLAVVAAVAVAVIWTAAAGRSGGTSVDLSGLPGMPADTRQAYEAAPSHRDLFAHLPCYCGCGRRDRAGIRPTVHVLRDVRPRCLEPAGRWPLAL